MSVNFEYYKIFYHVVQNKSITAAAKTLYVTQPTVTHIIKVLEQELGCQLFIRSKKGVTLTPDGELLFQYIKTAYESILEAEKKLYSLKDFSAGMVTLGASETTLHHFLFSYLKEYKLQFPNIHLKVHNHNTIHLIDALKHDALDFGILVCPKGYKDEELTILPLTSFSDIAIAGNCFSHLNGNIITLAELSAYPLISISKENLTYLFLQDFFHMHNVEYSPDIELATSDLIVPAVLNDLGIGFVPSFFATQALENKTLFKLDIKENLPQRDICLVHKKKKTFSLAALEFMKLILSKHSYVETKK